MPLPFRLVSPASGGWRATGFAAPRRAGGFRAGTVMAV
jgi:hypothetical protein